MTRSGIRLIGVGLLGLAAVGAGQAWGQAAVTVTDTGTNYVLSNGYLTASISKTTGDMVSLKVKGLETMGYVSGHHAGHWEQNPAGAAREAATVTIDPAKNGRERAEVSIKGWADGQGLSAKKVGADPGASVEDASSQLKGREVGPQPGSGRQANAGTALPARTGARADHGPMLDMEIRYSLGRGEHGIYTYAIFTHKPRYGATQLGESRYGFKLNAQVFDWLSVDEQRNEEMPTGEDWDQGTNLNMKEARRLTTGIHKGRAEHKYDYCADQFDTPAFGWASTKEHVGLYFINPSMEYLSSGPQHFELTGHLDDGDGGDPTLLDYWRGTHYGGSSLAVSTGEDWTKVVGPIFVYVNSGATPQVMFKDAKAQAVKEAADWPYGWVSGVDYPQAAERGVVKGQLVLKDSQAATTALPHLLVGLAYPEEAGGAGEARELTWQSDAKHYEFWVRGTADGRFTIPKVRPGTYELHAIADGVLGEFERASVTVGQGETVDLGKLSWTPVRYGRQVFQIGVPDRSAAEFYKGDDHWHWGLYAEYAKLFPRDEAVS
jgi:rhamnogalacturonan endolyase